MEINVSKFKEQCLALIDQHGKAVARVIPAESGCAALIGSMKGRVKVKGNVFSTGIGWNAES